MTVVVGLGLPQPPSLRRAVQRPVGVRSAAAAESALILEG
ncbi:unnamed protein product [[Actinomadura] parvosata subsp. kistnae]|nr:unnamed protein product [Actinomadura parvosata subsp. kistnae]